MKQKIDDACRNCLPAVCAKYCRPVCCGVVCRRGLDGRTAIHAAAYSANVATLRRLVDAGGDLRLHDHAGRSARDWAASRRDSRQRTKVLHYLTKAKLTALNSSTKDFLELSMHAKYVKMNL